jgi:hypothetical protein
MSMTLPHAQVNFLYINMRDPGDPDQMGELKMIMLAK